jgi:protein phosphatase
MMTDPDVDEIVFQVLLTRMRGKQQYRKDISEDAMARLCEGARSMFDRELLLLRLDAGIAIVGDLHGNVDDLLRIFERLRYPPSTRYLFLGDYIDRGLYGTEILMLLFAMKIKFPDCIFLLRGNHETEALSRSYGFYKEITAKYSPAIYTLILSVFASLPLCAVIGERIFCVHGGISRHLSKVDDLEQVAKPVDFTRPGLLTDLVWSDPTTEIENFARNPRGCGCLYGPTALAEFLERNDLDLLVRSHEACEDGTHWPFEKDVERREDCLTVFSSSNYCEQGNRAAVLFVEEDLLVNVEILKPMSAEEVGRQRIVLPYWLAGIIAQKREDAGDPPLRKIVVAKKSENRGSGNTLVQE